MSHTLFFTSPIGLGHASRDVAIASSLDERVRNISFVTGEPASKHISESGFDVMNLYTVRGLDVEYGEFKRKLRWLLDYMRYYKECKRHARDALEYHKPRLVIADEDYAAIAVSERSGIPRVLITDLFESRFTSGFGSILERIMNKTLKKIISSAELVLVPFDGEDNANIAFVGPIVRDPRKGREELRSEFAFTRKTILLTAGGTSAGRFLMERTVLAFKGVGDRYDVDLVIVTGPSLNFKTEGVRCLGYVKNLHEMIYASDLLISLAGRSTCDEASAYGTPAIFIPIKGHFEQEENARRYGFAFEDIYRLQDLMIERLDSKRAQVRVTRGAEKACELILDLL